MLKPIAFANSLTASGLVFYIFLYILKLATPPLFKLILNSQFFGADLASQVPKINLINFLGILIAISVICWVFGYILAIFYNHFSSK